MIILIASAVFVAACFFISFLPRKTKEIYGMDHALLNDGKERKQNIASEIFTCPISVSGSSDRPSSSTMWLNMGLWKDEDSYVDACAALASLLMDTALKGKQEGTKWKIFGKQDIFVCLQYITRHSVLPLYI